MRLLVLFIAIAITLANAYNGGCGTLNVLQNQTKRKHTAYASKAYNSEKCDYDKY